MCGSLSINFSIWYFLLIGTKCTKFTHLEVGIENAWAYFSADDLFAYVFLRVFFAGRKIWGQTALQWNMRCDSLRFALVSSLLTLPKSNGIRSRVKHLALPRTTVMWLEGEKSLHSCSFIWNTRRRQHENILIAKGSSLFSQGNSRQPAPNVLISFELGLKKNLPNFDGFLSPRSKIDF